MKASKLTYLKWLFLGLSVSSIVYAGFLMVTAKHSIDEILDAAALKAGTVIDNPDMTEYDGEQLVWHLQADSAREQGPNVSLENPMIDMFTEQGENIPIQAKFGRYNKQKQVIHFKGQVTVGFKAWDLSSEKLDFFKAKDEVVIPEAFVLQQDGITITGKDMRIYRKDARIEVLQGVHMIIEESP